MIAAIIVALFIHYRARLWHSKLLRGDYGVGVTSWVFAFFGSIAVAGLGVLYVQYKANHIGGEGILGVLSMMSAFSSVGIAAVTVLLYQIIVILAVWRATAQPDVSFRLRWWCRYWLFLNVMVAGLAVPLSTSGLIMGAILYWAVHHFWLKKRNARASVTVSAAPRIEKTIPAEQLTIESSTVGAIEVDELVIVEGEPCLATYIQRLRPTGQHQSRIHISPELPAAKIKKAIAARFFKAGLVDHQPLMLIDDSKKQNGEYGLLVTDQFFDFKAPKSDGYTFSHSTHSQPFTVSGTSLRRFNETCITFFWLNAQDVAILAQVFNEFFADRDRWWRLQAAAGQVESQFKLSCGVSDEGERMYWLRQAAEQGHIIAQSNLGAVLMSSTPEEAFVWLSRAAEQGSEHAARRLGDEMFAGFRERVVG